MTGSRGGTDAHDAGRDQGRHDRAHDRHALAGHRRRVDPRRRPRQRTLELAGGQGLEHGDPQLPGAMERGRRLVGDDRHPRLGCPRRSAAAFTLGHAYRVRVRASDAAGNWSAWIAGRPVRRRARPGWQLDAQPHAGTGACRGPAPGPAAPPATRRARAPRSGARSRAVPSRSSRPEGPSEARPGSTSTARSRRTIHLNARRLHPRRLVFTRTWLASGDHSIRVVVVGSRHHRRVDVDAFVILR